jgi:hypothetical protein
VNCPGCDHADRENSLVSLFGTVCYRHVYYYRRHCDRGHAPFDEQAGITPRALTLAAEQLATLAGGVCDSFERGADLLQEMAAVRLSESIVERTTEDVGHRIAVFLEASCCSD